MAKLEVPGITDSIPTPSPLPLGRFSPIGHAVEAAASIGETEARAGEEIGRDTDVLGSDVIKQGQDYFNTAKQAMDDSLYNKAYSKASLEFNTAAQQRMNQPYDQNGNPTYGSLTSDIQTLGQQIANKYGNNIADDSVRTRFLNSMNSLVTNHSINSLAIARKQQLDDSVTGVNNYLQSSVVNALSDKPSNYGLYYNQGLQAIDNAMQHGYITDADASQAKDNLRHNIYFGGLQMMNQQNPIAMKDYLANNSDSQLNITPQERLKINEENEAGIRSQQVKQQQQQREQQQLIQTQQEFNKGELELKMMKGNADESTIVQYYNKGMISHTQEVNLLKTYYTAQGNTLQKTITRTNISTDMSDGKLLSGYKSSQIDDHYNNRVSLLAKNGQAPSLSDKAMLAADYKAPVNAFENELKQTMIAGDPQSMVQAAKAYNYVVTKNPLTVSTMDKKSIAALSALQTMLTTTNMDPAKAVDIVKKSILSATPDTQQERLKNFNNESDFKPDNLQSTIVSLYKGTFSRNSVAPDLIPDVSNLLHQAYSLTGDAKAAEQMVKNETADKIGLSDLNGGHGTVMFAPPEKIFGNQFSAQELRTNLNQEIAGHLPQGTDPNSVLVNSDAVTRAQMLHGQSPSYSLYTTGAHGEEVPVLDKNGMPLRWTPTQEALQQQQSQMHEQAYLKLLQQNSGDTLAQKLGLGGNMNTPRGIANNNPGNIGKSSTMFGGEVSGNDPRFRTFATPQDGISAISKLLTDYANNGHDTIQSMITRWAPPNENDTQAYISAVSQDTGISPTAPLNMNDPKTRFLLTKAIIHHENGQIPYSDQMIQQAVA